MSELHLAALDYPDHWILHAALTVGANAGNVDIDSCHIESANSIGLTFRYT